MEENNEARDDIRGETQLERALSIVQSSKALTDDQNRRCLEILRRLGNNHRQRVYFPDETAAAVISLVTKSKEPEDGGKRSKQVYHRVRDEIQSWGLTEQVSLENSNLKDFADVCVKLAFEPEHTEALVNRYHYVVENVLLGGKTLPYTIAAVIINYAEEVTGSALGPAQINEMSEMLHIKQKTLRRYTETLAQGTAAAAPPPPTTTTTTTPSSPKRKKTNPPSPVRNKEL